MNLNNLLALLTAQPGGAEGLLGTNTPGQKAGVQTNGDGVDFANLVQQQINKTPYGAGQNPENANNPNRPNIPLTGTGSYAGPNAALLSALNGNQAVLGQLNDNAALNNALLQQVTIGQMLFLDPTTLNQASASGQNLLLSSNGTLNVYAQGLYQNSIPNYILQNLSPEQITDLQDRLAQIQLIKDLNGQDENQDNGLYDALITLLPPKPEVEITPTLEQNAVATLAKNAGDAKLGAQNGASNATPVGADLGSQLNAIAPGSNIATPPVNVNAVPRPEATTTPLPGSAAPPTAATPNNATAAPVPADVQANIPASTNPFLGQDESFEQTLQNIAPEGAEAEQSLDAVRKATDNAGKNNADNARANTPNAQPNISATDLGAPKSLSALIESNPLLAEELGLTAGTSTTVTSLSNLSNATLHSSHAAHAHPASQMVAANVQKLAQNGKDTNILLQLDPPELGRVEVRMEFRQDKLKAVLTIEKPETYMMMQRDSQTLERALQNAGIDIADSSLGFEMAQDGHEFSHDGGHDNFNGPGGSQGGESESDSETLEIIETTMSWSVDPETGHTHYNILV